MKADEIIKVLNDLCEKFGIAVDWSSKNVLPYLQELGNKIVAYELWTSIMCVVFSILPFITVVLLIKRCNTEKETQWDEFIIAGLFVNVVLCLYCVYSIIKNILDIITCLTFPEKIIYEQCMNIYNSYGN